MSNMGEGETARSILNSFRLNDIPTNGIPEDFLVPVDKDDASQGKRIGTVGEIYEQNGVQVAETTWRSTLNNAVTNIVGKENPVHAVAQMYEDTVKVPKP